MSAKTHHPMVRAISIGMAYGIGRPVWKLLEATGQANRLMKTAGRYNNNPVLCSSYFKDYQPDQHDILVCTFPKSGTNWMLQICYQILHDGLGEFEFIHDAIPWPDGAQLVPSVSLEDASTYAKGNGMRVIKTHLAMNYIPYDRNARYIFIVRDPKDTFVSSYHFFKDVAFGPLMPNVETFLDSYLSDYSIFGNVAVHLDSYWQMRNRDNTMFLTFGEMKANPGTIIRQVADFAGISLSEKAIERVEEKSSFTYMKNIDNKFHPGPVSPFAPGKGGMIRKGTKGSSGELLTPVQQGRIDTYMRAELKRIGSDLPYDELFHN